MAEVTKKKNTSHSCCSTDHYANNCPKAKKNVYAIEKVPEEKSPTEDSESDSMGYAIRAKSEDDQDPREEVLLEYQEETQMEIQDIQLEAGMPQDTENKKLCKHTKDAQAVLVTPTKVMAYIHRTATKTTVCIDNSQRPLIIDSGAHCSIVARTYLDDYFPNWDKKLLPTKAKNFKSASGKMTSIGKIIKEISIPQRKVIDIYNSKNRHIAIGANKEKKFQLGLYQISTHDPLEELLNEFKEGQLSITLTSKQKLSLLKILRKNRPAFSIGEEPLGKIRGHDIDLYLDVEIPYQPMLGRPPYPAGLETRKEIEKHINVLLDMDVIRKIGHNEIVENTTPVLITWHYGNSRLCGDFRALNNYTKAEKYHIPRLPHALDKLAKTKYITKIHCMKGFYQNGVKPNSIKLLRIICPMGIFEYTKMPFGIKNAPPHFQRIMDTIFQEEILEGWMVVYIDDIVIYAETWEDHMKYIDRVLIKCTPINLKIVLKKCNFGKQELLALGNKVSGISLAIDQNKLLQKPHQNLSHIASSLLNLCAKNVSFEITKERRNSFGRIKHELTNLPVLILPEFELPFKLYIDAACSQGLGESLHQRQIVDSEPREEVICYTFRQLKDSEARYGATQTELLCLIWALEKLHYYLEGAVVEFYTDSTALKSLLNMKTSNRHILPLNNVKSNPAYDPEVEANIPIHFMEIVRRKNFKFYEWAPGSGTPDSGDTDSEVTETPILELSSSELHNEFFSAVMKTYTKHKQCGILLQLLQQKYRSPELESRTTSFFL
ncbi:hypothetical protein O181_038577 [Austropuccinia psidii MF-1]|uniref:Reverse transcriptase n=1 Tax=Austropuccinia psidii MF-1 TaxID=1389203 RepID=A0A9Q3DB72_9BASI|nr:hypothetical protein [Austropuccinia psidii MF-1]